MGIDVGYLDLVCQIGSPRSIATFLQRVGRSGHSLGLVPKGRLFPLSRDELLECLAVVRAVRQRAIGRDRDSGGAARYSGPADRGRRGGRRMGRNELYELCRAAWPYPEHDAARISRPR